MRAAITFYSSGAAPGILPGLRRWELLEERRMDKQEAYVLIEGLKVVFDIVRLVDVTTTTQYTLTRDGRLIAEPYECYAVWHKDRRCENCVSAKAFAKKGQLAKYEFIGKDVYYVMSKYVLVDEQPYMLEMVSRVTDETLFAAYGKSEFVNTIEGLNKKLYTDPLTGAYNRRYYNDQLCGLLSAANSFALVDVDRFKQVNDSVGHPAGDLALKAVAGVLLCELRRTDAVIRYGGDEFFLVFHDIPRQALAKKLEAMRERVAGIVVKEYPSLRLSVSIGATCGFDDPDEVLKRADKALYQAKKRRDCVCVL